MDNKSYKNLEVTAKCNTLLILADDFKHGGGKPTLISMYFFLKENKSDRDLFVKLLSQLPENIYIQICKVSLELGDGAFEDFMTHHKILTYYTPDNSLFTN